MQVNQKQEIWKMGLYIHPSKRKKTTRTTQRLTCRQQQNVGQEHQYQCQNGIHDKILNSICSTVILNSMCSTEILFTDLEVL